MGWPAVSAPPKAGSAPPPQAPNPPNQVQIWHCTNFSSCEAGPNPPPPPLKLQLHDLKKRRVLTPFSSPLGLLLTHIFYFFWHSLVLLWFFGHGPMVRPPGLCPSGGV